jgi:hypothetical protein
MNLKPRTVQLGILPGGRLGMVYEDGQPIPPQTPLPMTAGKLNELLNGWIALAAQAGHGAGARAVAGPQYEAGIKAGAQAGADAAYKAAAGPAARAGVKAGIEYAYASSVVRRRVERDEKGQITGIVEERVPLE